MEKKSDSEESDSEEFISSTEDLLREHGLLNRMLLIYDHFLSNPTSHRLDAVKKIAALIRLFVEDYHEKMEEKCIFPLVLRLGDGHLKRLVKILIRQHKDGRVWTDVIMASDDMEDVVSAVENFTKMYRTHESREDTEVFEFWRGRASPEKKKRVSKFFSSSEEQLLGEGGFGKILDQVMLVEKKLRIDTIKV
jgi:hemerythrin-like domain-containing protein